MESKEQLEFLEFLNELPKKPKTIPCNFVDENDCVKVPKVVREYLNKFYPDLSIDLDQKMKAADYRDLMLEKGLIEPSDIIGITFKS